MERKISESAYDVTPLGDVQKAKLAEGLDAEAYSVLIDHGTEPPFCGNLTDNKMEGTYACRLCGLPLFSSQSKFDSGTGWASFYAPYDKDHLHLFRDTKFGMIRTEIRCARCDGHQGHVFPDGPPPTGMRFCLNSASLSFFEIDDDIPQSIAE